MDSAFRFCNSHTVVVTNAIVNVFFVKQILSSQPRIIISIVARYRVAIQEPLNSFLSLKKKIIFLSSYTGVTYTLCSGPLASYSTISLLQTRLFLHWCTSWVSPWLVFFSPTCKWAQSLLWLQETSVPLPPYLCSLTTSAPNICLFLLDVLLGMQELHIPTSLFLCLSSHLPGHITAFYSYQRPGFYTPCLPTPRLLSPFQPILVCPQLPFSQGLSCLGPVLFQSPPNWTLTHSITGSHANPVYHFFVFCQGLRDLTLVYFSRLAFGFLTFLLFFKKYRALDARLPHWPISPVFLKIF